MYKLLSHNDLDGVGCGILAKLAFNDKVKIRYNSITALDREIEFFLENDQQKTFLFITDLSPNEENEKGFMIIIRRLVMCNCWTIIRQHSISINMNGERY